MFAELIEIIEKGGWFGDYLARICVSKMVILCKTKRSSSHTRDTNYCFVICERGGRDLLPGVNLCVIRVAQIGLGDIFGKI